MDHEAKKDQATDSLPAIFELPFRRHCGIIYFSGLTRELRKSSSSAGWVSSSDAKKSKLSVTAPNKSLSNAFDAAPVSSFSETATCKIFEKKTASGYAYEQ